MAGQYLPSKKYMASIPSISQEMKNSMLELDCSIAPSREALLPIMARSHFGAGDKSKWGWLGSRKAVDDERKKGKSIHDLSSTFEKKESEIKTYILEYKIYLHALGLVWNTEQRNVLTHPSLEFNPPIRFLQTKGHKDLIGISIDKHNHDIKFYEVDSKRKFQHLIKKLVVEPQVGLGATAKYEDVFKDYVVTGDHITSPSNFDNNNTKEEYKPANKNSSENTVSDNNAEQQAIHNNKTENNHPSSLKSGALFDYPVKSGNAVLIQLMKEAKNINSKNYPGASTALVRSLLETILKQLNHQNGANPEGKAHSLESAINLYLNHNLSKQEHKDLKKEFKKSHLDYINMNIHGNTIPNYTRLKSICDSIDLFVMRNI